MSNWIDLENTTIDVEDRNGDISTNQSWFYPGISQDVRRLRVHDPEMTIAPVDGLEDAFRNILSQGAFDDMTDPIAVMVLGQLVDAVRQRAGG